MKIVFFGSSDYILSTIETLNKNFDLTLVVTTEKENGAVPKFCTQNNISFISIQQFNNITIRQLLDIKAPLAIVADFGLIIPEEILNNFPEGMINLHPSLLPKYRGPTPVQTVILNGDKITGISIMKIDDKVDHGPILAQEKEEILDSDTAETLYKRLFDKGAQLLPKTIGLYLTRGLKLFAQDHSKATHSKTLTRQDGYVDLTQLENKDLIKIKNQKSKIARMIRAYFPWPGVWTKAKLNGKEKIIKLLPNQTIQVEGKKSMSYKDFANGYIEGNKIISKLVI